MISMYKLQNFESEAEACTEFDRMASMTRGMFAVYRECRGVPLYVRPGKEAKSVRIDRILAPTKEAVAAGWRSGLTGIEIKRDYLNAGKAVSQAMDYLDCVFTSSETGVRSVLNQVCIFPFDVRQFNRAAESIANQYRIGAVKVLHDGSWELTVGRNTMLHCSDLGCRVICVSSGRKFGSR